MKKVWKNTTVHIKDRYQITEDTYILTIKENIDFIPGQFIMLDNPLTTRKPFILGLLGEDVALSIQVKGKGTQWILERDTIQAHFPLGKPFVPPPGRGITIVSPASFTFGCSMFRIYGSDVIVGSRKDVLMPLPFPTVIGDQAFAQKIQTIKGQYDYYVVNGSHQMEHFVYTYMGKNVYVSIEEYMACGIGACKGCAVKTREGIKHVCIDGPIFRGDEIWY